MVYASHLKDLPEGEYWAILTERSTHIPSAGRGYDAYTQDNLLHQIFENEEEFEKEIQKREENNDGKYVAMKCIVAKINKTVTVSINTGEK